LAEFARARLFASMFLSAVRRMATGGQE